MSSDLNLVFGMIALQCDFITKEQLFAGMQAWIFDKSKSLGDILVEQKALDVEARQLLDPLVKKHLAQHGNDPLQSLAALSSRSSTDDLLRQLPDADLQASLAQVHAAHSEPKPVDLSTIDPPIEDVRFRILRPHAKGGLGIVYVAHDREVNRQVALKEIQSHRAADANSRARFLLEAEITGGLEHPGIVPIYGLGHYADGRPFYAMRFIQGDSLQTAVDAFHKADVPGRDATERDVSLKQLLRRFIDVCNAIDYAHSKGVLHRDLKPGNVMLGKFGETLVVDWGLAKATGTAGGDSTPSLADGPLKPASGGSGDPTMMGCAIGTPQYMPPEQAAGRLDLLGPRSDVYSLGATLYHVLTGRPPIVGDKMEQVLRDVQRGKFPRPREIKPAVDSGLEAICVKALAIEPAARYASAAALRKDVDNWIADAPISARLDPLTVKARRWVVRHRVLVATCVAALLVAIVGLGAIAFVTGRANEQLTAERDLVAKTNKKLEATLELAEARRKAAETAEGKAKAEAELSNAVREFLRNDLLQFASVTAQAEDTDLREKIDPDLKVHDLLLRAGKRIDGRFPNRPLVECDLRRTIGNALNAVGRPEDAIPHWTRALEISRAELGPDHPQTLGIMIGLANSYDLAGRADDALKLRQQTLKLQKDKLDPNHPDTLASMHNLAISYAAAGRAQEALTLRIQTLELREAKLGLDHPQTLLSMAALADSYTAAGRVSDALKLREQTLKLQRAKLGPDHPETVRAMALLAWSYQSAGQLELALPLTESAFLGIEKLRLMHPASKWIMSAGIKVLDRAGRLDRAETWGRKFTNLIKESKGPQSTEFAEQCFVLADLLVRQQKYGDAEPVIRECLAVRALKRLDGWKTPAASGLLGATLLGQKKLAEGEPILSNAYRGMKRFLILPLEGRDRLLDVTERLASCYEAGDRPDEAAKWRKIAAAERAWIVGPKLEPTHDINGKLEVVGKPNAAVGSALHLVRFKAGVIYVIDMTTSNPMWFDPYLQVRDAAGKVLADDDDSGGGVNARIVFRPAADGVYQVRTTSSYGGTEPYNLTIRKQE
jgi:eukaryotic-like serine/threonine-protein kinase